MSMASAHGADGATAHAHPAVVGVVGANGLFGKWLVSLINEVCPDAEVLGVDADATVEDKTEFVAR